MSFATAAWLPDDPAPGLDGTNIEAGLTRAVAQFQDSGGVILLFTDGRATSGDAVRAASRLRAQGHTVHVIATGVHRISGPRIVGIEPPGSPRIGQPAQFLVHIRSDTDHKSEIRLLDGKGAEVDRVPVPSAHDAVVAMRCLPRETGLQNYKVVVTSSSREMTLGEQTVASAPLFVEGPPRVLLLDTVPEETAQLVKALSGSGVQVDAVTVPEAPYSYDHLVQYDAVILSDCAFLNDTLQAELIRFVEESGGGLVFVGGRNVSTAAWHGSLVERALPITFVPERVKVVQEPAPVQVCFVLDKSGSMESPLGTTALGTVATRSSSTFKDALAVSMARSRSALWFRSRI